MDQENLIKIAVDEFKTGIRLAAPPRPINYIKKWFDNQTSDFYVRLKRDLNYPRSNFEDWWRDLYNNYQSISSIKDIFEFDLATSPDPTITDFKIINLGLHLRLDNFLNDAENRRLSDKLEDLCQLLRRYVPTSSTTSSSPSSSSYDFTNVSSPYAKKTIDETTKIIPEKLFETFRMPNLNISDEYVDFHSILKFAMEKWVKDTYYDTPEGIKEVALKYLCDTKRFDFERFWEKIYYRYSNNEITAILDTVLDVEPPVAPPPPTP